MEHRLTKVEEKEKHLFVEDKMLLDGEMFDAIVVAEHMLVEQQKQNPNTRMMLFVLTDGESNRGYYLEDIKEITRGLRIPIYTIGYNADIDVSSTISGDKPNKKC